MSALLFGLIEVDVKGFLKSILTKKVLNDKIIVYTPWGNSLFLERAGF